MARRDERAYPPGVCDRGATKPDGPFRENPPGGGSFGCGPRWLGRYSPLWGCSSLAALAATKIPRRRTPRNFKTRSQAGRLSQALSLVQEVLERAKPKLESGDSVTLDLVSAMGSSLREADRCVDAEVLYRELLPYRRKNSTTNSLVLAGLLSSFGECLLLQGKFPEAELALREALTIHEQKAPEKWETSKARSRLGMALLGQKQYAQAEPLLMEGYQGMKQREFLIPKGPKGPLKITGERLVQLYEEWGKPQQAADWREKLSQAQGAPVTAQPAEAR